ncbi:MAG: DUF554 domain-containing protein [Clostridia bacterium]|nr:DUF554 domain-containing protein [Clostridia bacterium]
MIGTLVNTGAILVGGALGLFIKKGLPPRITDGVMKALGLVTVFIGVSGAIESQNVMVAVLSVVLATVLGAWIDIDGRLHRLSEKLNRSSENTRFSEGFMSATLLFVTGAMAVTGAMQEGMNGDYSLLFTKAIMDGISALLLSAALGAGVLLSAVSVLIYQGGISLISGIAAPVLTAATIVEMGAVGSILVIGVGLNLLGATKVKVFNSIFAILLPIPLLLLYNIF